MTKDEKIQELLKVLDTEEDEQYLWLCKNDIKPFSFDYLWPKTRGEMRCILADLAFRMRDEADKAYGLLWSGSLTYVYYHIIRVSVRFDLPDDPVIKWFAFKAQPIHWIVAAEIAKVSCGE